MSEIRTCEEFVVNELLEAKDRIDELVAANEELRHRLSKFEEMQNMIERCLEIELRQSDYQNMKYINIGASIWADHKNYDTILNILAGRGYDFTDEDEGKTE